MGINAAVSCATTAALPQNWGARSLLYQARYASTAPGAVTHKRCYGSMVNGSLSHGSPAIS